MGAEGSFGEIKRGVEISGKGGGLSVLRAGSGRMGKGMWCLEEKLRDVRGGFTKGEKVSLGLNGKRKKMVLWNRKKKNHRDTTGLEKRGEIKLLENPEGRVTSEQRPGVVREGESDI